MLVVLSPIRTKAIHEVIDSRCTDELKISLREEASLLTYRLSKVEKKGNVTYTLYFYNISDNLYEQIMDASLEKLKTLTVNIFNVTNEEDVLRIIN